MSQATHPPGRGRILAPALAGWCVTAAALHFQQGGLGLILVSACAIVIIFGVCLTNKALGNALLRVVVLTAGVIMMLGISMFNGQQIKQSMLLDTVLASPGQHEIQVTTTSYPRKLSGDREASWVRAQLSDPHHRSPVLLFLNGKAPTDWELGTTLTVTGTVQPTKMTDEHAASISVSHWQRTLVTHTPFQTVMQVFAHWASQLRSSVDQHSQEVPGAELVPGLAVGATNGVPEELTRHLTEVSLTHLTAVSGANCALVTGGMLWALRWCGVQRRVRLIAAFGALFGFAVIVGPDASLQRAAVMSSVILLSQFSGQPASAFPALGIAVVVLLVMNPWQAINPGFALSVCATLGILCGARPWAKWLQKVVHFPPMLAVPLGVTAVAQLACTPVLLLLQPGISLVSIVANLIVAPAAPPATFLGLIATLLLPIAPGVGHITAILASYPAQWIAATAQVLASLEIPHVNWPPGWIGAILFVITVLPIFLAHFIRNGTVSLSRKHALPLRGAWQKAPPLPLRHRQINAALLALGVSVASAVGIATPLTERINTPTNWTAVACDVGQGDAFLFRDPMHPEDTVMLDTGDNPDQLQNCIDTFGVNDIALLILSHDDRDHIGALTQITPIVQRAVIAPPTTGQQSAGRPLADTLEREQIPYTFGDAGQKLRINSNVELKILAPTKLKSTHDTNEASLVIMLTISGTRILLLGDTGANEQRELMEQHTDLSAEIVKVAHHGSRDQYLALAAAVGADWALVSVGSKNSYGHPALETTYSYEAAGSRVLRTDLNGSIALTQQPTVDTEPPYNGRGPTKLVPWVARPTDSPE